MKSYLILLLVMIFTGCSSGENNATYPFRAGELRVTGNATALYDINENGEATNIRILSAEPRYYFEKSLYKDIEKWHFKKSHPRKNVQVTVHYQID